MRIPLCPPGPVVRIAPLSNLISLGCKSILHDSWSSLASGKSTIFCDRNGMQVAVQH